MDNALKTDIKKNPQREIEKESYNLQEFGDGLLKRRETDGIRA